MILLLQRVSSIQYDSLAAELGITLKFKGEGLEEKAIIVVSVDGDKALL